MEIKKAESACIMQAAAEAGALSLWQVLDEHVVDLARLRSSEGGMPWGITDTSRLRTSHQYLRDLTMEEAKMAVALSHGVNHMDEARLLQAYMMVCRIGQCLRKACSNFGEVY